MHVVDAPVALFVTVSTVPKGSVGLAQYPAGASEYHVASPTSELLGAGRVVVVVVGGGGGGGGGAVVVVVAGGAVVVVVAGALVVVVVVGAVVVVVAAAAWWYATRCDFRSTPCADAPRRAACDAGAAGGAVRARAACAL